AGKGAHVILAVRNQEKGLKAKAEFLLEFPKASVEVRSLDLSDLISIRAFAEGFAKSFNRLDVLINNAGVMMPPYGKTANGFELQIGTNHMGHFALTGHLMPLLKATQDSRVVNVSSVGHRTGKIDLNDLNWEARKYSPSQAYGDSKIANIYFTYELKRRYARDEAAPTVTAAHPGWTTTDLQRHSGM
ncbi:MAG TPA: short-chain dehydrogenase, partial [Cytophagales bacterium]|nr:short-chain dehydrogenase [Cytophagales bacterium]